MPPNDNDSIRQTPKITPAHDEIASYKNARGKSALASRFGEVPDVQSGSASAATKTLLTVVVLALIATAGWSFWLSKQLQVAERAMVSYEARISDLEKRLSITDEDVSDSRLSMQVKMKEMDSEIRKLWDNVWKKSKQRLAEHDATLKKHDSFINSTKQQLQQNDTVIKGLKTQLTKTGDMAATVAANKQALSSQQNNLETASDKLNSVSADVNKLNRRVTESEEWIESINGFRRQVNRDLGTLKNNVRQLQSTAGSAPGGAAAPRQQ